MNAAHEAGVTPHTARLLHMPTALNWNHPEVQKQLGLADILIFQRNVIVPEVWSAMDYWRSIGKAVVVDIQIDDHYAGLPASNPAHAYWIRNRVGLDPDPVKALEEGMRHADALTAPSRVLLKDWEHVVPGYYLPNWTRGLWYEKLQQKPVGAHDVELSYQDVDGKPALGQAVREGSEGWPIIGWGGSISHVDSWIYSDVIEALDKLFEKWPLLHLKFCGNEDRLDYVFKRWGDRVIRQGGVRPEHWPLVVSTFDIGIAPLDCRPLEPWREGGPVAAYDERRSWLKGIEYLTAGVPWGGSQSATYADLARHGTLVENTPDAWFQALDKKLTYLQAEKELAWNERRWAFKHITFESNVNKYIQIMERILIEKATRRKNPLPGVVYVQQKVTA